MAAPSDDELLRAWVGGDRHAGEALSRRYYPCIRRFFDLRLPHLADDLTQQVLVAVAERRATMGATSFKAYVYGIARNLLLMYLRKQARHDRAMRVAEEDSAARTSLSVVAARREEEVLLLMAVTTLPPDLQIALELYYWEGMTTSDIGQVLEANPSTVGSRLARARELIVDAIINMTQPGALRDRVVLGLEDLHRSLGPPTLAANTR